MFLEGVRVNEEVVEVGGAEQIQLFVEADVDEMLEGGRGISQAERDYRILWVAVACSKCGLPFCSFCHAYLVVALSQVQLCVPLGF